MFAIAQVHSLSPKNFKGSRLFMYELVELIIAAKVDTCLYQLVN